MPPENDCPSLESAVVRVQRLEEHQFDFNGQLGKLNASISVLSDAVGKLNANMEKIIEKQEAKNERIFTALEGIKDRQKDAAGSPWVGFIVALFKRGVNWLIGGIFVAIILLILLNAQQFISKL